MNRVSKRMIIWSGALIAAMPCDSFADYVRIEPQIGLETCAAQAVEEQVDRPLGLYHEGARAWEDGDAESARRLFQCSINAGGAYMFDWVAAFLKRRGEPEALDLFLAGAVGGSSKAQEAAGALLLKRARTLQDKRIALVVLAASLQSCDFSAVEVMHEYAVRENDTVALIEVDAWLSVYVKELAASTGADGYFIRLLKPVRSLLNGAQRAMAKRRAAEILENRPLCVFDEVKGKTNMDWKTK